MRKILYFAALLLAGCGTRPETPVVPACVKGSLLWNAKTLDRGWLSVERNLPLGGADVYLISQDSASDPVDPGFSVRAYKTMSDATGGYEFPQVIPGKYTLLINSNKMDARKDFPEGFGSSLVRYADEDTKSNIQPYLEHGLVEWRDVEARPGQVIVAADNLGTTFK